MERQKNVNNREGSEDVGKDNREKLYDTDRIFSTDACQPLSGRENRRSRRERNSFKGIPQVQRNCCENYGGHQGIIDGRMKNTVRQTAAEYLKEVLGKEKL